MILNINWSLLAIFIIGLITRNNILAAASGIILVLGVLNLDQFYPLLERRGIEAGLLFLTMAILVPLADGKVSFNALVKTLTSSYGLFAVIGGLLGAYLNAQGITLISIRPDIIPGILIGVVISVAFFGGAPVGPVMAAGITAVLLMLIGS
ncbi:MAG: DUF441 domain-containing protein [Firmicutes bacterium]|jgi:uncharacterized membrane protein (DUF441 family)|nr:DUF441 domain-containing protein [Bacillota bacterium]